jgi:hypothetical protein
MKQFITLILLIILATTTLSAQKMLLLEQTNVAKTTKMYLGETLIFRLEGEENYWYERTITDIFPETNSLLLDNYLVKVDDIAAIKVHKKTIVRIVGGAFLSLGITLGFSTGIAALYGDSYNYPLLIGGSAASFLTGRYMLKRKKLKLGDKHRLRAIEVKF